MNPTSSTTVPLNKTTDNDNLDTFEADINPVDRLPSSELQNITNDPFFDSLIESDKYVSRGPQDLKGAEISLPMRSSINDIKYEASFRRWFRRLMKTVVGGEEPETSSAEAQYSDSNIIQNGELWFPSCDLSDWDTCYNPEELFSKYYQSLPKSRKEFLHDIQSADVLSILFETGVHINMRDIKAHPNTDHMKPLYNDLYDLYLEGKKLENLPKVKKAGEQPPVMGLFSCMDLTKELVSNLSDKILSSIQKMFLQSNSHTEISRLVLFAEMSILDSQPLCSIKDEFILSLAYLDWLFGLPPVLPLNSTLAGQLSTIRASNVDALFAKLSMFLSLDITFPVPPIDELNTSISPLLAWFVSSGIFSGYSTADEWSSPALATLSALTPDEYQVLHIDCCKNYSMARKTKSKDGDNINTGADTNECPDIAIVQGYYAYETICSDTTIEDLSEFSTNDPSIGKSPYKDVIEIYPPIDDIIGRDMQAQLSTTQRSIYPLSSETMFIRLLLENIYLVGSIPYDTPKKKSQAYTYVPYEMLAFLSQAPDTGLYWSQSMYLLIRHVLDCIIVRDVAAGVVYSATYSRFMQFYEQLLKEVSNSQNKSPEQLDDMLEAHMNDIFNLDLFTKRVYFKQAHQHQSLNLPANAGKYFSTLIVRGVLSRLPAHSKLLIKLLLHISISFMVYLRVLTDYELYVTTSKKPSTTSSSTFHAMKDHLSHTPSWRMFILVVNSLARFLASGQIKADIFNMFFITRMNYKDCLDAFELDSAFEEDTEISPEIANEAQDLIKLVLTRTIQIFYSQFMREEAYWAIHNGVPEHKIDRLVYILHSSQPITFYFYNIAVLLCKETLDSDKNDVSRTIPLSDLPYAIKYLQSMLPDIKFYKQTAGSNGKYPCIYAVSAARTLIIPLPLPLDDSNKDSSRFTYRMQQHEKLVPIDKDCTSSRWSVLREAQQSWTCIYLRHKNIYTLNSTREENLAAYLLYRVTYNMIACRAHGHVSVIEKILTSKPLPNKYLSDNPLFSSTDYAYIRKYIAESNKLADEMELRVQSIYKSCSTGSLDLFAQSLLPFNVNFTFKECIESAILRLLMLRLMAMFDTDLIALDFSPLWDNLHHNTNIHDPVENAEREPYVFGGESIIQHVLDNSTMKIASGEENRQPNIDGDVLPKNHQVISLLPSGEKHQSENQPQNHLSVTPNDIINVQQLLESTQSLQKIDVLSLIFTNYAHCTDPYPIPQWNLDSIDSSPLTLQHQQQRGLPLKYTLFPGFYLPQELSILLNIVSELTHARYTIGLDVSNYTQKIVSFMLLTHYFAAHLSAGDLLLMLTLFTGISISASFSNRLYIELSLRYPIFHQILSTRILEDILTYLPEDFLEQLGLSLCYIDSSTYLNNNKSDTIKDLTTDQQELLEIIVRSTGLNLSYINPFTLISVGEDSFSNSMENAHDLLPQIAVIVTKNGIPDSLEIPIPNSTNTNMISLKNTSLTDLIDQINRLSTSGISVSHVATCFGLENLETITTERMCPQDMVSIYNILQILAICNMCH